MDSENNPLVSTPPAATTDDPVLTVPSPGSHAGSSVNGNKSSSRASSIEALNWSDFEDEAENSQINSNLLQSIHTSSESTSSSTSKLNVDPSSKGVVSSTLMEETLIASSLEEHEGSEKKDEPFEHLDDTDNVIRNRRRESAASGDQMVTSYVSVGSDSSSIPFDQMSNVPVLDDGPIWSKGAKHYRFEENRIINQKLTFCVLLSLVLAIGLGLGNLVAYNECEAEHRVVDQQTCAKYDEKPIPTSSTVMPSKATASESAIPAPNTKTPNMATTSTVTSFNNPDGATKTQPKLPIEPTASTYKSPPVVTRKAKPSKPMIDPDYKLHAQELSRVLKMLDELSRKIDQFENTTRQLGGIIMMRDEYVKPRSPKSKFLKLLDEIVHERGIGDGKKSDDNDKEDEETDLNAEAEKVLDKIAEAVLNVMNSNLLSKKEDNTQGQERTHVEDDLVEEETKLETKEVFPLDDDDDSLFLARHGDEEEDMQPAVEKKTNRNFDPSNDDMHKKDKILEDLKPSTLSIMQTHKFGEDSDMVLDYRGGDKRINRDSYDSGFGSDVEDFDEFKEKHEKTQKRKGKSKSKGKRSKSKDKNMQKQQEAKKDKNNLKKGKDRNNGGKDWLADRAKLREQNRKTYPQQHKRNKKLANWQIERDLAREKIRENV